MFRCRGPFPREDELPPGYDLALLAATVMGQAIESLEYDGEKCYYEAFSCRKSSEAERRENFD
jgi:hypothetical protein